MYGFGFAIALVACGPGTPAPPATDVVVADTPPASPAPAPAPAPAPEPPVRAEERYAASHVVIAWQGAAGAPASVTRTEDEARSLAEAIHRQATAGEDFAGLAREHSDAGSKTRGGSIGVYLPGTMMPELEAAVAAIEVGAIAPPTRTAFGWHVIRRDAIVQARVAHVLIAWQGADRSQAVRTREEAKARAEEVARRLAEGQDFGAVARELSDDPSRDAGGDIGIVVPGQMVPAFEAAVFALKAGETSGLVETPYGWHVIRRVE